MAGSYGHVSGKDGGWSLIENMGDAYECIEQLLWLVESKIGKKRADLALSRQYYPMKRGEKHADAAMKRVDRVMGQ